MIVPDPKRVATVITARIHKDGGIGQGHEEASEHRYGSEDHEVELIAEEILGAVEHKSKAALTDALHALCEYIREKDLEQDKELE